MIRWVLIDDMEAERATYADHLSADDRIEIAPYDSSDVLNTLRGTGNAVDGVLVDVDLSADLGSKHSGPGVAQDIRVAQQDGTLRAFPLVRFSMVGRVAQKIGSDTSSDDLFDLKIDKDGLTDDDARELVRAKMLGVSNVYEFARENKTSIEDWTALSPDQWGTWGHSEFEAGLRTSDRDYLRAREFMNLIVSPGLLINEHLLAIRLGISMESKGWETLREALGAIAYNGVSAAEFPRWWAAGLDDWWFDEIGASEPLSSLTVDNRMGILSEKFGDLSPLPPGQGSPGNRPWRYCTLTLEKGHGFLPVDPSEAIRMTPRRPMPSWVDPQYAAIGPALELRDPRLDPNDLERAQRRVEVKK